MKFKLNFENIDSDQFFLIRKFATTMGVKLLKEVQSNQLAGLGIEDSMIDLEIPPVCTNPVKILNAANASTVAFQTKNKLFYDEGRATVKVSRSVMDKFVYLEAIIRNSNKHWYSFQKETSVHFKWNYSMSCIWFAWLSNGCPLCWTDETNKNKYAVTHKVLTYEK
jgi:hypothetical protein